jgi:hypothetical protein
MKGKKYCAKINSKIVEHIDAEGIKPLSYKPFNI